jgi:uncharacterized BrkB/YihY/UPF0761 family membrane protein
VAVIVNIVALGQEEPAVWVGLLALLPLAVLLFTGLYLFVLPERQLASWHAALPGRYGSVPRMFLFCGYEVV